MLLPPIVKSAMLLMLRLFFSLLNGSDLMTFLKLVYAATLFLSVVLTCRSTDRQRAPMKGSDAGSWIGQSHPDVAR
jgi:hypothetical protein